MGTSIRLECSQVCDSAEAHRWFGFRIFNSLEAFNSQGQWRLCNGVRNLFLGHYRIVNTNKSSFEWHLSIVADNVHPFLATIYSYSTGSKSSHAGFINMTVSPVFFSGFPWHQDAIRHLCGVVEQEIRSMKNLQELCDELSYQYDLKLRRIFPTSCGIHVTKNWCWSESEERLYPVLSWSSVLWILLIPWYIFHIYKWGFILMGRSSWTWEKSVLYKKGKRGWMS